MESSERKWNDSLWKPQQCAFSRIIVFKHIVNVLQYIYNVLQYIYNVLQHIAYVLQYIYNVIEYIYNVLHYNCFRFSTLLI